MGKKARLKKQLRIEQVKEEKQAIETRRRETQRPLIRMIRRVTVALIITIGLLYIGQVVNKRIASSISSTETTP